MKQLKKYLPLLLVLIAASVARAQGGDVGSGCDSSPENPTAILALAGSIGAGGAMLRARYQARKARKSS